MTRSLNLTFLATPRGLVAAAAEELEGGAGNTEQARMPGGMHATASGTILWTSTQGVSGITDPALGGRVVIFAAQASLD